MQGTVKYSEEFITPDGRKFWVGHEIQYEQEAQDPPFDKVAQIVKEFGAAYLSPSYHNYLQPQPAIQVEKDLTEDARLLSLISDLNKCTTREQLKEYDFLATAMEKKGDNRLRQAYTVKKDLLDSIEINKLSAH